MTKVPDIATLVRSDAAGSRIRPGASLMPWIYAYNQQLFETPPSPVADSKPCRIEAQQTGRRLRAFVVL